VDEPKSLFQRLLLGVFIVGVGLLVELSHILHHLKQREREQIHRTEKRSNETETRVCARIPQMVRVCASAYPVFVRQTPDPGGHLDGEDEEEEEEELQKQNGVELVPAWWGPQRPCECVCERQSSEGVIFTSPSMHGDSLMAPQQPRNPTTIISAPAAIRMYTPNTHTHTHTHTMTWTHTQ